MLDDHELLATVPAHGVLSPGAIAQRVGHRTENSIPAIVAMPIVDTFEVIQVEHDDRGKPTAIGRDPAFFEQTIETAAIRQAGEGILVRQARQLVYATFQLPALAPGFTSLAQSGFHAAPQFVAVERFHLG